MRYISISFSVIRYPAWCDAIYELYKLESCEEFERQWSDVIAKYKLESNKLVKGSYEINNYW